MELFSSSNACKNLFDLIKLNEPECVWLVDFFPQNASFGLISALESICTLFWFF